MKVRKILICVGGAVALAMPVSIVPISAAQAQQRGDTQCGADGKVYHYDGSRWYGGILDCAANRGGNYAGNGGGGGGGLHPGDTKCGADGKVYRYDGSRWYGGILDCK